MFNLLLTVQSIAKLAELVTTAPSEAYLAGANFIQEQITVDLIRTKADPETGPPDCFDNCLFGAHFSAMETAA